MARGADSSGDETPSRSSESSSGRRQSGASSVAAWSLGGLSWEDWKVGLLDGALPQLPLSTLNSVISVCCLAQSLYPEKRKRRRRRRNSSADDGSGGSNADSAMTTGTQSSEDDDDVVVLSRREVCCSVGLMNLVFCPFGAMPNCHGAGGLAGQHKFGTSPLDRKK
jgi:hypothetical protein